MTLDVIRTNEIYLMTCVTRASTLEGRALGINKTVSYKPWGS